MKGVVISIPSKQVSVSIWKLKNLIISPIKVCVKFLKFRSRCKNEIVLMMRSLQVNQVTLDVHFELTSPDRNQLLQWFPK